MSGMAHLADPGAREPSGRAHGDDTDLPGVGVLVRNEILKTRHRIGFWVGLLFFLLIVFLQAFARFWPSLDRDDPSLYRLPGEWPDILLGAGPMASLFVSVVTVLLVGSEWGWKTARQNVIDGLGKDQFFLGKALITALVAVVFMAGQVALAGGMAAWNTDFGAGAFVRGGDLLMGAGALTVVLGYASIAFLVAFTVRSTGSAIGVYFIYIALVEQLVGAALARREWSEPLARYLPRSVFDGFLDPAQYDPERRELVVRRAVMQGRAAPEYFDTPVLFALAAAWVAALVGAAWLVHRKRDL